MLAFFIGFGLRGSVGSAPVPYTALFRSNDDAPVAHDDGNATTEGGAAVTGNVLSNDTVGADQPGTVSGVRAATFATPTNAAHGTLSLNANDTNKYTPKAPVPAGSVHILT